MSTMDLSQSRVSGTPSITESPRQMTPSQSKMKASTLSMSARLSSRDALLTVDPHTLVQKNRRLVPWAFRPPLARVLQMLCCIHERLRRGGSHPAPLPALAWTVMLFLLACTRLIRCSARSWRQTAGAFNVEDVTGRWGTQRWKTCAVCIEASCEVLKSASLVRLCSSGL